VRKDPVEAAKWYRLAAEQGDASGQFFLGAYFEFDKKDRVEAVKWYRLAAEQDHEAAQQFLDRLSD
jgi:TPR repeat protein